MFAVTLHFLDADMHLWALCLGLCEMPEGHSNEKVYRMLRDLFVRFGLMPKETVEAVREGGETKEVKGEGGSISLSSMSLSSSSSSSASLAPPSAVASRFSSILSGCTDNASYFPKAFEAGEWIHNRCVCHTMQLSINKAIKVSILLQGA